MSEVQRTTSMSLKTSSLEDFTYKAVDWIYKKQKLLITLSVALVILFVSGYGIYRWKLNQDNERHKALFLIEKEIRLTEATSGNIEKSVGMLDTFLDRFPSTPQSGIAHYYKGTLHMKNKEWEKAIEDFHHSLEDSKKNSMLHMLASVALANAYKHHKEYVQAKEVLENIISTTLDEFRQVELAETYLLIGDMEQTKSLLKGFVKDFPQSPYAAQAKQILSTL